MDRAKLAPRGPVRRVVTERLLNNVLCTQEQDFDRDGKLISDWTQPPGGPRSEYHYDANGNLLEFHLQVSKNPDGSYIEIQELPLVGNTLWSMDGLHGFCFRTSGAKYAETVYDSHGAPVRTIFRGVSGEVLPQLLYVCDENGNILEAHEGGGTSIWFLAGLFRVTLI